MRAAVSRLQIRDNREAHCGPGRDAPLPDGWSVAGGRVGCPQSMPKAALGPGYRGNVRLSGHDMVIPI